MKGKGLMICLFLSSTYTFANDRTVYNGNCEGGYHFYAIQELNPESNFMIYHAELTNGEGGVIAHQINGLLPGFSIEKNDNVNYNMLLNGSGHRYFIKIRKYKSKTISNHFNALGVISEDYRKDKLINCSFAVMDNIHDI